MRNYMLMHKNSLCGIASIDEEIGKLVKYKEIDNSYAPFLGNATVENMRKWWELRSIPASRDTIKKLINSLEVINSEEYLAKNLALSVSDTYWIRPIETVLDYEDVNFFNLKQYNDGKIPYHNATSYDPNASLGGQMEKYWNLSGDEPVLVKEAYKYFGQQAVNEVFATKIHEQLQSGVPFVSYSCMKNNVGGIDCKCKAFTSKDVEFISAYEVVSSKKISNDTNMYNAFINICIEQGIDAQLMQDFMDYQTLTDFVISNTDEHLMNFGVLRDTNSMKLIGPAPIFDSGNSMFYSDLKANPFSREELLQRKITSFYASEEKMLKNVVNKTIVKTDLLPSPKEVESFYVENGINEERASLIATNYDTKCVMLDEFVHGKSISLYSEKRVNKSKESTNLDAPESKQEDEPEYKIFPVLGISIDGVFYRAAITDDEYTVTTISNGKEIFWLEAHEITGTNEINLRDRDTVEKLIQTHSPLLENDSFKEVLQDAGVDIQL